MILSYALCLLALRQLPYVVGQTFSACNPLHATNCPPDAALGKAIRVDFSDGPVDSFVTSGTPSYDDDGVHFTVAKSGDAPQLNSLFYIMYGKVSITMKTASGVGIVSSLVLQSDTLDEIDMEWIGSRGSDMQTNYFGKGDTSSYDRGAFNSVPNHQNQFITYTIEWTQSQITWSVEGKVVRVLTPAAAAKNQYPQSPMQVKFGAWSGGDSSNSQGTITWAGGPTDYSKGPFTMSVKSIAITDYSTGTQYRYGDQSGSSGSIISVGGKINGNSKGVSNQVASADMPSVTSLSPSIPAGLGNKHDPPSSRTGWPWVATSTSSAVSYVATPVNGLPSGWVILSTGKVVPANSAAIDLASSSSPSSSTSSRSIDDKVTSFENVGSSVVSDDSRKAMSNVDENQSLHSEDNAHGATSCNEKNCRTNEQLQDSGASFSKITVSRFSFTHAIFCWFGLILVEQLF